MAHTTSESTSRSEGVRGAPRTDNLRAMDFDIAAGHCRCLMGPHARPALHRLGLPLTQSARRRKGPHLMPVSEVRALAGERHHRHQSRSEPSAAPEVTLRVIRQSCASGWRAGGASSGGDVPHAAQ